jgi:hypothetical protein
MSSIGRSNRGGLTARSGLHWVIAAIVVLASGAHAQQESPFRERDEKAARVRSLAPTLPPPLAPMDGQPQNGTSMRPGLGDMTRQTAPGGFGAVYPGTANTDRGPFGQPMRDAGNQAVERMDLPPIDLASPPSAVAPTRPTDPQTSASLRPQPSSAQPQGFGSSRSSFPTDLWRGLDLAQIEQLIARTPIPPRSAALQNLWLRLLTTSATPPTGSNPGHLRAVQLEGLYRSGALTDMSSMLDAIEPAAQDALVVAFRIRRDLAKGNSDAACASTRTLTQQVTSLPKQMRGEVHLLGGYCAARAKNTAAAGLSAELAREEGVDAPLALAVLDSVAGGAPPTLQLPKRILMLDYRLLELLGPVDAAEIVDKAEPALLAALSEMSGSEPRLRAIAAEAASRIFAVPAETLGAAYRAVVATPETDNDPTVRQGLVLQAIEREPTGPRRDQLIRVFVDEARKTGLYNAAARIIATLKGADNANPTTDAAADLAAELTLASGNFAATRALAARQPTLAHWRTMADLFDPDFRGNREQTISTLDDVARRARLSPDALHKLATVLDALDINVPIRLWEAASSTPQPTGGYLPETGALSQLDDGAKKKEIARTVLLSLGTLGPNGPAGAHIIALGDTIRALRRAGLDADARRIGLEAVLGVWPRSQSS